MTLWKIKNDTLKWHFKKWQLKYEYDKISWAAEKTNPFLEKNHVAVCCNEISQGET